MKLWENGTFYQMTAEGEQVSAVLTKNGQIHAVGEVADLKNNMLLKLMKQSIWKAK